MIQATLGLVEAAKLLHVHPKTLQKLARQGEVPACKFGRSWVFVEQLLLDTLVSKSISRVSVVDLQEKSECRSTDARTHRFGGSSYRQSKMSRSLYSKALGLPTSVKRSRSATSSPSLVGNKTGLA
jgi:excisionase family DNA binding protein